MNSNRRRYRRPSWFRILAGAIVIAVVGYRCAVDFYRLDRPITDRKPPAEGDFRVVRVIDGDTLLVSPIASDIDSEFRVRLLGIDCPESVKPNHPVEPWGPESSRFTKDFVGDQVVRLRFDRRRFDKYDRLLAYVFVGDVLLNEQLVLAGLAEVSAYPGDSESMALRIRKAERIARLEKRGIWSAKTHGN